MWDELQVMQRVEPDGKDELVEDQAMQAIRLFLMLAMCVTVVGCSTAEKQESDGEKAAQPQSGVPQLVEIYRGSVAQERNACPVISAKGLQGGGRPMYRGVANIKLGGREKHVALALDGHGSFSFDMREGGTAPLFGLTLPTDQEQWAFYQGSKSNGDLFGSWGFVIPGRADLENPRLAIQTRNAEMALPLVQLGTTSTGHISVLKFSGEAGELVVYVPERVGLLSAGGRVDGPLRGKRTNDVKSAAQAYIREGRAYARRGQLDEAISNYDKAIEFDPPSADAYNLRGVAYAEKRLYDLAIHDFDKALELAPNVAGFWCNRGAAYTGKKQYGQAMADLDKASQLDPRLAITYIARGLLYADKREYEAAISEYSKALQIDPNSGDAYNNRGFVYRATGRYDQAVTDFNRALEKDPQDAIAQHNRGTTYKDMGEYDQAISDFNRALALNPGLTKAYANRGDAYARKGLYVQAQRDLNKAIDIDPALAGAEPVRESFRRIREARDATDAARPSVEQQHQEDPEQKVTIRPKSAHQALISRLRDEMENGLEIRFGRTIGEHTDLVLTMSSALREGATTTFVREETPLGDGNIVVSDPSNPLTLETVLVRLDAEALALPRRKNGAGMVISRKYRQATILGFVPLAVGDTVYPVVDGIGLRSEPSSQSPFIGERLAKSDALTVREIRTPWIQVTAKQQEGWTKLDVLAIRSK